MMNERKKGILLSYINFVLNAGIMLVYVPMLLHYVSKSSYGVYQMVGSFIGIMVVLDFGLGLTVTRFLAREIALARKSRTPHIIGASASLYAGLTGILFLIGVVLFFCIKPLYQATLSAEDVRLAQQIYLVLLFNFSVCVPGNLFVAILQAHERFVFLQRVLFLGNLLSPLLIWAVLWAGSGVLGVVWVQTSFNVLFVVLCYLYCKFRLDIPLVFRWKFGNLHKRLIKFSFFVFVGNVAGQLYMRLGPLVLGILVGAVAVANYYIASQLLLAFSILATLVGSVFLPRLTGAFATESSLTTQNDLFCKTGRLQLMVAFLLLIGFILLGKPFLVLWLGAGNEVCYGVALVIMAGNLLNIAQSVGPSILLALDKYRVYAYVALSVALLNIVLSFPLIKRYGMMGCAVSYVISTGIINGILLNGYYRKVGLKLGTFFREIMPVILGSGAVWVLLRVIWHFWPVGYAWRSFILHGIGVVAVFTGVMAVFVWNRFERDVVREVLQKIEMMLKGTQKSCEQ